MWVTSNQQSGRTNNIRAYNNSNTSIAARIQAFQTLPHTKHNSDPAGLRRDALTSITAGDGGIVVGRGRRKELNFATPASRGTRDGAESTRTDGRLPIGPVPLILHPSFEEKEVYFRPHSRASAAGMRNKSIHDRTVSPGLARTITPNPPIRAATPNQHSDGTTNLLTARSRLRSIVEREDTSTGIQERHDLTINDLGDMIDDAIEHHANNVPSQDVKIESYNELTQQPAQAPQKFRSATHENNTNELVSPEETPGSLSPNVKAEPHQPTRDPNEEITSSAPLQEEVLQKNSDTISVTSPRERPGTTRRRESPFRRYNSQKRQDTPIRMDKHKASDWLAPVHDPTHGASSPVKKRAALYESEQEKATVALDCATGSGSPAETRRKAEWSQYQKSNEWNIEPPITKLNHQRRASLGFRSGSNLIPLTLPRLVKSEAWRERSQSVAARIPSRPGVVLDNDVPGIQHLPAKANEEPRPISQPLDEAFIAFSNIPRKDSHISNKYTAKQDANDVVVTELPSPSRSRRPSKWDLLQRNKASRGVEEQNAAILTRNLNNLSPVQNRSHRPSMIESRIQDLMTVSKQTNSMETKTRHNNAEIGKVKQSVLFEGVADVNPFDPRKLPELQMPISEQAEAMNVITPPTTAGTPTKFYDAGEHSQYFNSPQRRDSHPVKPLPTTPSTPVRGRSRKIKQSLSPRGLPYAIEQRFSLSPSRSRSRCGNSGVFVSVEVRNSPEKNGDGIDEHEVIVRASVEPNDIEEESTDCV